MVTPPSYGGPPPSSSPQVDPLIGKMLGQFEIIDEIGRGGMATVYRARQRSVNRMVAIKVLPRSLLHDPSFYERFAREVDLISHLEHPHILPIYDYGESEGIPYIAMRFLAGGSMAQMLRRGVPPMASIERPFHQIAQALDYAHQQGVIHRDLKPGNILLDENGNAYLSDFGIARVLNSSLTGSAIIGTPAYMSPEQANGFPLDARSDVYALGIVLFELVTGREPFEAETPVALLLKHINEPMPSARAFRPGTPRGVEDAIFYATTKNPDDRIPSAGELADLFSAGLRQPVTGSFDQTMVEDLAAPNVGEQLTPRMMSSSRPYLDTPHPPSGTRQPVPTREKMTNSATVAGAPGPLDKSPAQGLPMPVNAALPGAFVPQDRALRDSAPRGASPLLPLALVILVLGIATAIAFVVLRPGTASGLLVPTPFAGAQRVSDARYSLAVPEGWVFSDTSEGETVRHLWRDGDEAYVLLVLTAPAAAEAAAPRVGDGGYTLIDEVTSPSGVVRRSYQVGAGGALSAQPGQLDYYLYPISAEQVVAISLYAADSEGEAIVPVFQQILDSLRLVASTDQT